MKKNHITEKNKRYAEEFLISLYESTVDGLYVLSTVVPTPDVICEMFETLNQRGEQLLTVDLFKNFLFGKFEKVVGIERVEKFWDELINIAEEEKNLKFFLRHFWQANYHFVREKRLFKSIKQKIDSLDNTEFNDFTSHILDEETIYFALKDPDHPIWSGHNEISQILDAIYRKVY